MMNTVEPMRNLSPQQRNEVEQLFNRAVQSAKANDYVSAAQYYRKAAEYGHPGAQNNLGNQYKNGHGVDRNPQEAFRLFSESAKQGNVFGMRNIASCYMDGVGVDANFELAVDWLETAAEQKDHFACAMLAKIYDSWQHKDEEKKMFWHKKAAEYGNVDSMFFLGEYYGKQGDNQDKNLAVSYYEDAAKAGKFDMKLKVAKALDMPAYGEAAALSLDRAEYWYKEVINGDDDRLKLDAAKGLDEQYTYDGELKRSALDAIKAYMTYRTLGMNGNKEACALAAYCSEIGKGTNQSIDIAIMLYEKAGHKDKVEWCKKKKSGNLSDYDYEEHLTYTMPSADKNMHAYAKEYYNCNVDLKIYEYEGRIYYIKSYREYAYLCSSDPEGQDVRIVSDVSEDFEYSYIHINITGIYLYYLRDGDRLLVQHIGFDGKVISECREEYDSGYEGGHSISNVYFYDNNVYFVYDYHLDEESKCQIKCMCVDNGETKVIYEKATSVERLFATADKLIFLARYENDECEESWADGWMIFDFDRNTVECLSNPYCSPENVIDNPDIYDEESPRYNDWYNYDRKIVFFDINRSIFWTKRESMEGEDSAHLKRIEYWEPHEIWGNREDVVSNMPIWKNPNPYAYGNREYFDGVYHYYSESYYTFKSSDIYGNIYEWSTENGGHGVCDEFTVIGDYMYLNIAAYDEEQYPLTVGVGKPIRKSWFDKELPREVVEQYKNIKYVRNE